MTRLDPESDRTFAERPLSPTKLAHLVFRTSRFAETLAFWKTLLNATTAFENEQVAFIRYDDEHHRIAFVNVPPQAIPDRLSSTGFEHVAFTFDRLGDLLATYRRLKAQGIDPAWCINHGITTSIYYADPDGNKVELQFDNMDSAAADGFMSGKYFSKNPMGVDFDPELLTLRYLRGDPIEELTRLRSALPAFGIPPLQPEGMIPYDRRGDLLDQSAE